MIDAFLLGIIMSLGIVLVIGPQNLFLLKSGLKGQNPLPIIITYCICDTITIVLGVFGLGSFVNQFDWLLIGFTVLGICFLLYYAFLSLKDVLIKKYENIDFQDNYAVQKSTKSVVFIALALAFNPSTLADNFIILPAFSAKMDLLEKSAFVIASILVMCFWASCLGYASGKLRHLFTTPKTWRILDFIVFLAMSYLAFILARDLYI